VNDDYSHLSFARYGQNPGHLAGTESGPYDDPVTTLHEQGWDPVEELTYLLQDAAAAEYEVTVPPPRTEAAYVPRAEAAYADEFTGDPTDDPVQITAKTSTSRIAISTRPALLRQ